MSHATAPFAETLNDTPPSTGASLPSTPRYRGGLVGRAPSFASVSREAMLAELNINIGRMEEEAAAARAGGRSTAADRLDIAIVAMRRDVARLSG